MKYYLKKISNQDITKTMNLNKDAVQKYFNVDQYTDVIAFNLEDENKQIEGEIYISIDDVLENSK